MEMNFRSAVTNTLAARNQKDLVIVNLMQPRAGTYITNSLSDSDQSRSPDHCSAWCLILPIFRNLWHQSTEKCSKPFSLPHAWPFPSPTPTPHTPFSTSLSLRRKSWGYLLKHIFTLGRTFFFLLHLCLSYNMLLQMPQCFVGVIIYSKCISKRSVKCRLKSLVINCPP